jgi:hypothetical protein
MAERAVEHKAQQLSRQPYMDPKVLDTFPEVKPNLFIHIPKTAGLSIKNTFGVNLPFKCVTHHATYKQLSDLVGETFLDSLFTFSCVRDPYERLVSAFAFVKKPPFINRYAHQGFALGDINEFVDTRLDEELVKDNLFLRPQHSFVMSASGEVKMDYIVKYEDLEDDWAYVSDVLFGSPVPIRKHIHQGEYSKDEASYILNKSSKEKIYDLYKEDFEMFEYEK